MESNGHWFYVVRCKDETYYAGYTTNLEQRIDTHNAGKGAKYTRGRIPVTLLFAKKYETKRFAMQMEYNFKQLNKQKKQIYIETEVNDFATTT